MTKGNARLISKAELLRRVERSRTRLYEDASERGVLRNALTPDGRVDLDHIDAVNYCHQYNYQEPNVKAEIDKALKAEREKLKAPKGPPTTAGRTPPPPALTPDLAADLAAEHFGDNDEVPVAEYMNMTLNEIVHRFGTHPGKFLDYVRARKVLSEIQAKDEDSARKRGEHVPMSLVLNLEGHIDALQTALLAETTTAIRSKVTAMIKAGADESQIERTVHDLISRTIKTTKETTTRVIRNAVKAK